MQFSDNLTLTELIILEYDKVVKETKEGQRYPRWFDDRQLKIIENVFNKRHLELIQTYSNVINDKIGKIDDTLQGYEDWMHGKQGDDCTAARKLLIGIQKDLKILRLQVIENNV